MSKAYKFTQPMKFTGNYYGYWAGYKFKEALGYTAGRHTGVDYNWGSGDQDLGLAVSAIANGTVCYVGNQSAKGYGKTIIIRHVLDSRLAKKYGTLALYSRYMHLQHFKTGIKKGQVVKVGETIGTCGKTGTIWAHLHLDLWKNNLGCHLAYHKDTLLSSYLDPYKFIEANKNNKEVYMWKGKTGQWWENDRNKYRSAWKKEQGWRVDRDKKIKSLTKTVDNLDLEIEELEKAGNISKAEIVRLKSIQSGLVKQIDDLNAENAKLKESIKLTWQKVIQWIANLFNKGE